MELLRPSHPPAPRVDYRYSLFSSSTTLYGAAMERLSSSSSCKMPLIVEEEGGGNMEKVYVAVGKSAERSVGLLNWTMSAFGNCEICIVHVHQPSPFIPTLLGKLPASQANGEVVAAYRREESEKMRTLLNGYLGICFKTEVKASLITVEAEQVQKGLVDLVIKHDIRKLIMGAIPENCVKMKKSSKKATYAAKHAPAFCEIWFINKGKHVWTRKVLDNVTFSPGLCRQDPSIERVLRSKSLRYEKSKPLYSVDCLHSISSRINMQTSQSRDWVQDSQVRTEDELVLLHTCSSENTRDPCARHSSTDTSSPYDSSAERRASSDSDLKLEEESLHIHLAEAKAEAEASKHEAIAEFLKRKKLEAEAVQMISKVKDYESAYAREAKHRIEAEDELRTTIQHHEKLLEEKAQITLQLQKTMRNVAVLDNRVHEANRRCDEASGELKLVQDSISSLKQEKQSIRRQKVESERWLERWRNVKQSGGTSRNGYLGFLDDMPEVVEFSLLDLQTATCNFSESFKLGEGGFGCVYKGELLDRTVAIKRLHAHNIQGPSQFQKEVQVLGKLRHPHLATLIGACPEAWSLVYNYLPNGSLQLCLFRRGHNTMLPWQIRTRLISEISSALLFLHSSHPERIIHGDLKPENILLDSELHGKISHFGLCRFITEDTLRCPSFRRCTEPKSAFPYADPEFNRTGILSPKSDVYSFGVVILQLLTGRPPVGLVADVRRAVSGGKLASVLDKSAGDWEVSVVEKLAEMGLKFCESNSRDRPELTPSLVRELQQLHTLEERQVPSFFLCPILQEIMHDPQVAADGFTYEGEAIRGWLRNGRETSPMTNLTLDHLDLVPNHTLRLAIQDWLCKY